MIRMDEFNKIRKAFFQEGLSINEIARKFKRSWETVDVIVKTSRDELEERGDRAGTASKVATEIVENAILAFFEEEVQLRVKKKQRYTARKIFNELKIKGLYNGSERTMQSLVKRLRRQHAYPKQESYLPLEFELGSALQIDHGEVDCIIAGERAIRYLFVASIPGEVLRYCQLFPVKSREAWGEFHERVFRFFGGIFTKMVYDNDTVLIKGVNGETHTQTEFSLHLEEHYGFESHFCNLASGNEKGAVENGVGYSRRNYLPGCPSFEDFTAINSHLENKCLDDIANGVHYRRGECLSDTMVALARNLKPFLPIRNWKRRDKRLVNSFQQIEVENHFYSVPENFIGSSVRVGIGAFFVDISHDEKLIIQHPRKFGKGEDSLFLDHYLDQLQKKPGAFWDCKATKTLVLQGDLEVICQELEVRFAPRQAQLEFIKILSLKRHFDHTLWAKAIKKAIECQSFESEAVESILRMLTTSPQQGHEAEIRSKLSHLAIPVIEFDLEPYALLAEGGSTC